MSERLACKAVGLARSTYGRLPVAQTPADPDAETRACHYLRGVAERGTARAGFQLLRVSSRREAEPRTCRSRGPGGRQCPKCSITTSGSEKTRATMLSSRV